jgi:hypothetical protein
MAEAAKGAIIEKAAKYRVFLIENTSYYLSLWEPHSFERLGTVHYTCV